MGISISRRYLGYSYYFSYITVCIVHEAKAFSNICHEENGRSTFTDATGACLIEGTTSTTISPILPSLSKLVDDKTANLLILILYSVVNTTLCICGGVSNIINIIVFTRQGFGDTINISLFGLAVSDLGNLITLLWLIACYSPVLQFSDVPFIPDDVSYLTAGWPRIAFTRITAWITAFITFERCLCIAVPLKVKMIITPRRTQIIIAAIFICMTGSVMPMYYTSRLVSQFSQERNRTVLGLAFTEDREKIDSITFIVCSVVLPMLAFVTVVICTVILAVKLNSKAKWRKETVKKSETVSNKDKKIIRLVGTISTIFIICSIPNILVFLGMSFEPEFNIDGLYKNLIKVIAACVFVFESVNSSINIFLYMKMSSKFKATLTKYFVSPPINVSKRQAGS